MSDAQNPDKLKLSRIQRKRDIFERDEQLMNVTINFSDLSNEAKFIWLFTNENLPVLKYLGNYIIKCLDVRQNVNKYTA